MRTLASSFRSSRRLGFLFLYAPIISLVVFSFNANRLVTVWSGFSLAELLEPVGRIRSCCRRRWLSLQIAAIAATIALVLGTLCAYALVRFRRFRGKTILQATVSAPLVMPDVITGLALLLLFVAMQSLIGWPSGRGVLTIIIAHSTFCTAYVTVVVQSRLTDLDLSLEEAAMDLGATPVRVFFDITLPIIAPALVSGWLLAFTLSPRRSGDRELRVGTGLVDAANGDLLEDPAGRRARGQRAGHHHHRRSSLRACSSRRFCSSGVRAWRRVNVRLAGRAEASAGLTNDVKGPTRESGRSPEARTPRCFRVIETQAPRGAGFQEHVRDRAGVASVPPHGPGKPRSLPTRWSIASFASTTVRAMVLRAL